MTTTQSASRALRRAKTVPLVSVIVPARDDTAGLRRLHAALSAQTLPPDRFEVLIGDDGSTDAETSSLATPDGRVRVLRGPPRNSYAARNRCALAARAPVLAFCDADCRPEPGWLEAGLAALAESDLVAGVVHFTASPRATIWTVLDVELFLDQEHAVRQGRVVTANLFVRRELFERLGGFDDSLPRGGDMAFATSALAAQARITFAPDAVVWHATRDRMKPFLNKVWVVGRCYAIRELHAGRRPPGLRLRSWIPILPQIRARRRSQRPLGLNTRRLHAEGIHPGLGKKVCAVCILYLALPLVGHAAQLSGWWQTRRA